MTYFEIPLEQEAFIFMIRDECFKQFGAPIDCRLLSDGKNFWFRTDFEREALIAKEITGLDWTVKEYPKPKEHLEVVKGFTYGT